jgi:hypothetical protein
MNDTTQIRNENCRNSRGYMRRVIGRSATNSRAPIDAPALGPAVLAITLPCLEYMTTMGEKGYDVVDVSFEKRGCV